MKAIIEQIEAAKLATISAIRVMEDMQAKKEELSNLLLEQAGKFNPEWSNMYDEWEKSSKDCKKAVGYARKQVTKLATLIGLTITKPMKYDYQIKREMYNLFDYANEIATRIEQVQEVYKQYN